MLKITLVLTAVVAAGLVALLATVLTPGLGGIGFVLSVAGGLAAIAGVLMAR